MPLVVASAAVCHIPSLLRLLLRLLDLWDTGLQSTPAWSCLSVRISGADIFGGRPFDGKVVPAANLLARHRLREYRD